MTVNAADFIATAEAARLLGISPQRLGVLLRAGRVPGAQRVGSTWIIPRATLAQMPPRVNGRPPRPWNGEQNA